MIPFEARNLKKNTFQTFLQILPCSFLYRFDRLHVECFVLAANIGCDAGRFHLAAKQDIRELLSLFFFFFFKSVLPSINMSRHIKTLTFWRHRWLATFWKYSCLDCLEGAYTNILKVQLELTFWKYSCLDCLGGVQRKLLLLKHKYSPNPEIKIETPRNMWKLNYNRK